MLLGVMQDETNYIDRSVVVKRFGIISHPLPTMMNTLEKTALSSTTDRHGSAGCNTENVPLQVMTSSNSARSSDLASRVSTYTSDSSSSASIIQTNTFSNVPTSASAHLIPFPTAAETDPTTFCHLQQRQQSALQRSSRASGVFRTDSPDAASGRTKRLNGPYAIATGDAMGDNIGEIPIQSPNRKNVLGQRHAGSATVSPTPSTPSTPIGTTGKASRFKFPGVKKGVFLFRKKSSCPSLNYALAGSGSGTDDDRTQSPSNQDKKKRQKGKNSIKGTLENSPHHRQSPTFYNNISNGVPSSVAGNANEISPLLKRINNRLHFDRRNRYSTASFPSRCHDPCCLSLDNCHHKHARAKRCASKEDPGPRTANGTATEDMIDSGYPVNGACNKSASYPTAFGIDGMWGVDGDLFGWNDSTKYKLVKEGQIQVCRLNHPRTVLGKLTSSKLLRRWETHTLILNDDEITSKTPSGFLEQPIKYASMEDVHALPQWDSSGDKHCVRIFVPEGSILLQTNHVYARNQWLFSIQWKRNLYRYRRVIESNCNRPEVILKEMKYMVELTLRTPLQGDHMSLKPVRLVCTVLKQISGGQLPKTMTDPVLVCVAPILDTIASVSEISPWLTKYCEECPRSRLIDDVLSDVAHLTLKKNMDFGKYTSARLFVQEFLLALRSQNNGLERAKAFVRKTHGPTSSCPHPRILPNLVSVCLAGIHCLYDIGYGPMKTSSASPSASVSSSFGKQQSRVCRIPMVSMTSLLGGDASSLSSASISSDDQISMAGAVEMQHHITSADTGTDSRVSSPSLVSMSRQAIQRSITGAIDPTAVESQSTPDQRLSCFCAVLETISEFEDWRLPFASLLQPIPFPDDVLANEAFAVPFSGLIQRIGTDPRCGVHLAVLGVREGKEGWFHLVCPGGPSCMDDGDLFAALLKTLLHCCCRRKKFLQSLNAMLGPLQLLSLRECEPAMEALCHMLELEVVEGEDLKLQMITALQSTSAGKRQYAALCDRQIALRELQQKGGPRKLTLPSKSTDADLAVLLSSGSFGNLEWLSLAFTNVTSACAEYLIKLPSLRYLNLWSTHFGDLGLQLISEHLHKLQVLNLCETPVTDKGLASLSALTNLRKLNLNSTQLSAKTFQMLRANLPALQEVDVRYTDAWCADELLAWSS